MAIGAGERVADPAALAQFVAAAERSLAPRRPVLIVMMGLSGSGKTRLASRLAPLLEAVHLQSDVERRRLAGMRPGQRSGSALQAGVYAPQATNDVYAHLAHCAEEMLRAGWSVIVDATFTARERRATMRRLAAELGVPLKVIACRAPVEVLRHRVTQRAMRGGDASEADATVLEWQLRREEPLRADEDLPVQEVDTSTDPTTDQLAMLAGRCH
jgi:predicted kinase